jgi:virginiamycin B lyase
MSMDGKVHEFLFKTFFNKSAVSMAVGADGKFYVLNESFHIFRATTGGAVTAFDIPSGDSTADDGLALGPDGNVWFAEANHIGKITPAGAITEYAYPSQPGFNTRGGVTAGSDGNVWFSESSQNSIGKVVPSTGAITMYPISARCTPAAVVLAKDNNVWFACAGNVPRVGRITPSGSTTTFPIGGTFTKNETEQFGARGPDGNPWFASADDDFIFSVDTTTHAATVFNPPLAGFSHPAALATGPDGNLWVDTVNAGFIYVLVSNPMTITPGTLRFHSIGEKQTIMVSEHGVSTWTASSTDPGVATVVQGSTGSTFDITWVSVGKCRILIADAVGNSVQVHVVVLP